MVGVVDTRRKYVYNHNGQSKLPKNSVTISYYADVIMGRILGFFSLCHPSMPPEHRATTNFIAWNKRERYRRHSTIVSYARPSTRGSPSPSIKDPPLTPLRVKKLASLLPSSPTHQT